MNDVVNKPYHYTTDESGVECIELASLLPFDVGNALKYVWRCGKKDDSIQELQKSLYYIRHCIENKLPVFIDNLSDTKEFEEKITKVKEYWVGNKYMFIDGLYWGNLETMEKAIGGLITELQNS